MLLTMVVGLYTSRVVLETLGISDYGLYNVVGGFVTMLSFLNNSMASGTQRFLTYALGEENLEKLKQVFSTALLIHIMIALIILVLSETIGLWFILNKINVPDNRHLATLFVYQFSVITFVLSVTQVPYTSSLIAHEKMDVYAYLSIYDVIMKLVIVYIIQIISVDKLILYSSLIALIQISNVVFTSIYCKINFEECIFRIIYKKDLFRQMTGFSVWTLLGSLGSTTNGQGVNVLLNMFFGTVVNAARGIAFQINSVLIGFSRNFQIASNPQIIKLYANRDIKGMTNLALRTSRFSAFLLIFLMLPFLIDIEFVLEKWLGTYPSMTPVFLRIIMIQSLIQTMSGPIVIVTHAGGKLKWPNLTGGLAIICFLPITYVCLKLGATPVQVFIINIIPWIIEGITDSYFAQKYTGFSMLRFYTETYFRVFVTFIISFLVIYWFSTVTSFLGWSRFVSIILVSIIVTSVLILLVGMKNNEIVYIFNLVVSKLCK